MDECLWLNLASYLSPGTSSFLKSPVLPSKPCQTTSRLVGKSYAVAGQASGALHTMTELQAYQVDLLKDLDQGEGLSQCSTAHFMSAMVAVEKHLWLSLLGIRESDKTVVLNASVLPSRLFGTSIEMVVEKYREARAQSAAFKKFIPRRVQAPLKPSGLSRPSPGKSSWRKEQKTSVAAQAPPLRRGGKRHRTGRIAELDLRAVILARR